MTDFRLVTFAAAVATNLAIACTVTAQGPFAYPPAGRTTEQQRQDQFECHQWAAEQSHFDPSAYAAQAPTQPARSQTDAQPSTGAAVIGGAARGALIAEVADEDSGDGGRAGATLGLLRARRAQGAAAAEQQRAQQQQPQQAAELRAKQDAYQRARSTCYRARGYTLSET